MRVRAKSPMLPEEGHLMRTQHLVILGWLCGTSALGAVAATSNSAWSVAFPATDAMRRAQIHQVRFTTFTEPLEYKRFYRFNQDSTPCYDDTCPQPADALQLNSSRVNDCWVQLAGDLPHSLRWELEVRVLSTNVMLVPEPNGIVFQVAGALPGLAITAGWHRVCLDREGNKLTVRIDDTGEAVTFVPPAARTPLRLTVRRTPLVWLRGSALYAFPEEPMGAAAGAQAQTLSTNIVWQEVYRQTFDTAESVKDFARESTNSILAWIPEEKCLRLALDPASRRQDAFATFHWGLPGDLRIRFRARNAGPSDQFFGVLINCRRILPQEDGYYCEWNRGWLRRIKKADVQRCIARPYEPEDRSPHWADYVLERAGDTIRMSKNGKPSLTWIDPDPIVDPAFGSFSFYNCNPTPMDFDDLVIERNARDISNELAAAAARTVTNQTAAATKLRDPLAADTVIVRQAATAAQPLAGGGALPLAAPSLINLQMTSETISFQWQVQAGAQYDVETCNSLNSPVIWTVAPNWSGVKPTGDTLVFSAPVSQNGHSFYRVVARPAP